MLFPFCLSSQNQLLSITGQNNWYCCTRGNPPGGNDCLIRNFKLYSSPCFPLDTFFILTCNLFIYFFCFMVIAFMAYVRNLFLSSSNIIFSSKSFIVLVSTFRYIIRCKWILYMVWCMDQGFLCVCLFYFYMISSYPSTTCWKYFLHQIA